MTMLMPVLFGSESRQQTLVRRVRRTASPYWHGISTAVTDRSFEVNVDVWNGRRQRQLSVDDTDAPRTAS